MTPIKTIEVKLQRTIPAAPDEVFDAWLDPKCPGTPWSGADEVVLDPKPGNLFYFRFVNDAGEKKPHYGRFRVVDRGVKVEYTWMSPNTRGLESVVTVTFRAQGEDTLLTLTHANLPDDELGRLHDRGWTYFLGRLSERLGKGGSRPAP